MKVMYDCLCYYSPCLVDSVNTITNHFLTWYYCLTLPVTPSKSWKATSPHFSHPPEAQCTLGTDCHQSCVFVRVGRQHGSRSHLRVASGVFLGSVRWLKWDICKQPYCGIQPRSTAGEVIFQITELQIWWGLCCQTQMSNSGHFHDGVKE